MVANFLMSQSDGKRVLVFSPRTHAFSRRAKHGSWENIFFSYLNLLGFGLENQCPKAPKKGPKSIENRGPGAPKSRFGGVLEGVWKVLAPKNASGRVLGGSWARLVGQKRPTWPQPGAQYSQYRVKIEQTTMKSGGQNQSNF